MEWERNTSLNREPVFRPINHSPLTVRRIIHVASGLRPGRREGEAPAEPYGEGEAPAEPHDATDTSSAIDLEIELKIKEELKKHFRPEFLNRIDETVVFQRLTRADLRGIVDRQVRILQQRLAGGTGVSPMEGMTLTLTEQAKDQFAADGYNPIYGRRITEYGVPLLLSSVRITVRV
ncbi:MAG: AAA family ATPase [Phycisphaerae bacterium]|nr:AAA family ATPase [Phycisphaerae bacterium]